MYDEIDMRSNYRQGYRNGFWVGATSTFLLTVGLLALVGLYA